MVVGIKDSLKLFGISVIACCAVFVCTLFLNYNADIVQIKDAIPTEAGMVMYHAQVSVGKVTGTVTGGCLVITAVIMLLFYVKNYIDTHGKELGILKALGYSDFSVAKHFYVFGLSVFAGCLTGFLAAFFYLPQFYKLQNAEKLFPAFPVRFHPLLTFLLVGAPALFFAAVAILYAYLRLGSPVLDLIKERQSGRTKIKAGTETSLPFLKDLKRNTLRSKKAPVFFVAFSAFCFSAMTQMAFSMKELSSETFSFMMITIGLILAFTTLFLSLSSVVKANAKTIAMMRVFGYRDRDCGNAILGGYRPFSYLGFAIGSVYQYLLLKIVVTFVFADVENMPEYHFDLPVFFLTLVLFILVYELILHGYSLKIKKLPVKSIMAD